MKPRLNSLAWMPSVTSGENLAPSLGWSMVVAASCCGEVFQWQGLGESSGSRERWTEQCTERSLMNVCSRVLRTSDWGEGLPSNSYASKLPFQPDRAWEDLQRKMGETPQIQVCQACSVIPKKTRYYNRCQRYFNKVLSIWILMQMWYFSFF